MFSLTKVDFRHAFLWLYLNPDHSKLEIISAEKLFSNEMLIFVPSADNYTKGKPAPKPNKENDAGLSPGNRDPSEVSRRLHPSADDKPEPSSPPSSSTTAATTTAVVNQYNLIQLHHAAAAYRQQQMEAAAATMAAMAQGGGGGGGPSTPPPPLTSTREQQHLIREHQEKELARER